MNQNKQDNKRRCNQIPRRHQLHTSQCGNRRTSDDKETSDRKAILKNNE